MMLCIRYDDLPSGTTYTYCTRTRCPKCGHIHSCKPEVSLTIKPEEKEDKP